MNARFWAYIHNSPVKISLRPMQRMEHHAFWRHDEGWSSESTVWYFDGAAVDREIHTDGVDCDGRLTTTYVDRCPLTRLRAMADDDRVPTPEWQDRSRRQRDYTAEMAGY